MQPKKFLSEKRIIFLFKLILIRSVLILHLNELCFESIRSISSCKIIYNLIPQVHKVSFSVCLFNVYTIDLAI